MQSGGELIVQALKQCRWRRRSGGVGRCGVSIPWPGNVALVAAALWVVLAAPAAAQPAASAPLPVSQNLAPGFAGLTGSDRVLLMPIDVELFSLSAGGVAEPRADWTAQALRHMTQAIQAKQQAAKVAVVELPASQADDHGELIGLHAAVARSIGLHQFGGPMWALPTKGGRLEWSFGDAMQPLRSTSGARYGLFIWVRDSYASPERIFAMAALAIVGIGLTGGVQTGYASLVDLDSGQVVWFNRLARVYGDLREVAPARESIDALLAGFPAQR